MPPRSRSAPAPPASRWSRPRPGWASRGSRTSPTRTSAARSSSTGDGSSWCRRSTAPRRPTAPSPTPAGSSSTSAASTVYHLGDTCLFGDLEADRAAHAGRRRADADRRPLHDGPPRRGRRGRADRRRDRDPVPLRHVPADRDRRARRSRPTSSRRPSSKVVVLAPGRAIRSVDRRGRWSQERPLTAGRLLRRQRRRRSR